MKTKQKYNPIILCIFAFMLVSSLTAYIVYADHSQHSPENITSVGDERMIQLFEQNPESLAETLNDIEPST